MGMPSAPCTGTDMDKTWKRAEREIADILGGQRNPVSGRQRGDKADIQHTFLSPEVKHRKKLPDWLLDALSQAEASKRGTQLPIVILHESGQKYADSLVVLRLSDFRDWFDSKPKDHGLDSDYPETKPLHESEMGC